MSWRRVDLPARYNPTSMDFVPELIIEVVDDDECGYRARALGEGIFTSGATLEELRANVRDAVDAYYDGDESRPRIVRLLYTPRGAQLVNCRGVSATAR
jgi:hypothetical protein